MLRPESRSAATITTHDVSPFALLSVWVAGVFLATAFFFTEHSVTTSQKLAFTLTAEEMVAEAGGGNFGRRLAFLALASLGVGAVVCRRQRVSFAPVSFAPVSFAPGPLAVCILAMLVYCGASACWSVDAGITSRRLFVLALATGGAAGLGLAFRLRELCAIALLAAGSLSLMGVVCELGLGTFQPWLSDYRFSGTLHPNTQGVYLATALFAALALCKLDPPRWIAYAAIMLVGFTLLVLTKSRTSTAGVMLTWGCLWLALQRPALRVLLPAAGLYCMAVGLLLGGLLGVPLEQHFAKLALLGREEQAESFSGRTTIWPVVTEFIEQRYWFGHGYDSFWTPDAIAAVTEACQWPVREAHSAYYETMLHLGLVGLLLLLVMVLTALGTSVWGAWWSREPAAYLFWAAMLTNGLFNGLFESGIVMITLPTTLIAAGLMRLALVREAVARQAPRKGAAWSAQLFWQRSFAT